MILDVPSSGLPLIQYAVPSAGQTVEIVPSTDIMLIEPAGLLATLTVNMPAGVPNGKRIAISSTQVVTTLNGISAFAAAVGVEYVFRAANSTWYKIQ